MILVDVGHFKAVNDTFGHEVGDEVLKTVAQTLLDGVREYDVVGRWGGEEFLVLCPQSIGESGKQVAERLAAKLRSTPIDQVVRAAASPDRRPM